MKTIFTKIIDGELPCHKIAENDRFFSFLSINPIRPGHTLVIPKKEIDYLFELDDDLLSGLFTYAKKIAVAIKKAFPCRKVAVIVYGLEVPHAHVHLIPVIGEPGEIDFRNAKKASEAQLNEAAEKIRTFLGTNL